MGISKIISCNLNTPLVLTYNHKITRMKTSVKRVYEPPAKADGTRVLVDRLWPRGLTKESAEVDSWLRDLAPSDELRKWFHAHTDEWSAFRKRYLKELASPNASNSLEELYAIVAKRKTTLLFASKDEEHNNAVVLRDLLNGMRKPPTGTGPAAARGVRSRQVKAMPRR
jgi:uncharacterized protein YeaO (DUF488 family)